ncbi:MAG: ATP-binding cassette domain-containing protein [Actinomycetota bacterium]|jgi:ABC-type branched-subunit amino acid transport system ATPase component|nr:ATP-binding cassette domain-containing protein [Actinomycetota bacterium]
MADPQSPALLEVRGLRKHFGGVRAVDGCDFSVTPGELVGLIGPNGAGKSTVIELLSGLVKPDAGTILFDGREIQGLAPHEIFASGLARCFQLAKEWPLLSVLENLLISIPPEGNDTILRAFGSLRRSRAAEQAARERAVAVAQQYRLHPLRNEYAYTLSGGQKRLLEFARIALAAPKLALLDEPMAGVNPVLQVEIERGIRNLLTGGSTVLLVEHNLGFVERICDRVIVMVEGKVAAVGSMAELRENTIVQDAYLGGASVA